MDAFWVLLITGALMAVYLAVLVRAAARGKRWAKETLRAIACMNEGSATAWFWFHERPEHRQDRDNEEAEETEPESELVA